MLSRIANISSRSLHAANESRYRLSFNILLGSAILLLLLSAAYGLLTYQRLSEQNLKSARNWSSALAQLIASSNTNALILNDIASMEASLQKDILLPSVKDIAIFRVNGRALVHVWDVGQQVRTEIGGVSNGQFNTRPVDSITADHVESWALIDGGASDRRAYVRIRLSLQERRATLQREWRESMLIAISLVGLLIFCLKVIVERALRPIEQLSNFAQNMPDQIGQQITLPGACYEATQLAKALNLASNQIASQLAQIQAVSDTATEAILGLSADGCLCKANQAALDFFGQPLEQLMLRPLCELIPELTANVIQHHFSRTPTPSRLVQHGLLALRHRGEAVGVDVSIGLVADVPSLRYVCIISDVSERIEAAHIIAERTAQLDAVFSLSPDGFVVFNGHDQLVSVNPAFERMTGMHEVCLPLQASLHAIWEQLKNRSEYAETISPLPGKEDSGINWQARLHLIRPHRRVIMAQLRRHTRGQRATILYLRDITHEDAVERMKDEFLATAAHELRTPIASIYGFTDLLLHQEFNQLDRLELLDTIYRQTSRLNKMVDELVDLARLEARQGLDFKIEVHTLSDLLDGVVNQFHRSYPNNQMTIAPIPELSLAVDAVKIQQALMNLLENAVTYAPAAAPVTISAKMRGHLGKDFAVIVIRDNGYGMTGEQLKRAFERFYRGDTSGQYPGSGLGLSLVKEIIELHKGRVELYSSTGDGTSATVWLPVDSTDRR